MTYKYTSLSEADKTCFIGEIKYYLLVVALPLNAIFLVFLLLPGMGKWIASSVILLDLFIYLTKVKPAFDDLAHGKFIQKRGVLRSAKFRLSAEKFEYHLDGEPEIFTSVTSQYTPCLEHEVDLIYAEKSHRIVKLKLTQ